MNLESRIIMLLAGDELRRMLSRRLLWFSAVAFVGLVYLLARSTHAGAGYAGLAGFDRTAATLLPLIILFVPLFGIAAGAGAFAPERERGTLGHLLAQPVDITEVFVAKTLGRAVGVGVFVVTAFGSAGVALATVGIGDPAPLIQLGLLAVLLSFAFLAIGLLISVVAPSGTAAHGGALGGWLAFVLAGDLVYLAAAVFTPTGSVGLFALLVGNPVQAFKVAAVAVLSGDLDALGPVGQAAMAQLGPALVPALVGLLLVWTVGAGGLSYALFRRREATA